MDSDDSDDGIGFRYLIPVQRHRGGRRRSEMNWSDPNYIEQRDILKKCLEQRAIRTKQKEDAKKVEAEQPKKGNVEGDKIKKDLPYDVLDLIFSYLTGAECQRTVMMACVDWKNRYDMDEAWKERVKVEFKAITGELLPKVYGYKQVCNLRFILRTFFLILFSDM